MRKKLDRDQLDRLLVEALASNHALKTARIGAAAFAEAVVMAVGHHLTASQKTQLQQYASFMY